MDPALLIPEPGPDCTQPGALSAWAERDQARQEQIVRELPQASNSQVATLIKMAGQNQFSRVPTYTAIQHGALLRIFRALCPVIVATAIALSPRARCSPAPEFARCEQSA